jgi:hypothetical protein
MKNVVITNEKDYDLIIDLEAIRETQNKDIENFMFGKIIEEIKKLSQTYKILKIKGE